MKKLLAAFIFISLFASPVINATPQTKIEAGKLLDLMNTEKTLNDSIMLSLDSQLAGNASLLPYKQVMVDFMKKYMSYQAMKSDLEDIYAAEFSVAELIELQNFYNTPTGLKSIEKIPLLMKKGADVGQKTVQANLPELYKMIETEMKKNQESQTKP